MQKRDFIEDFEKLDKKFIDELTSEFIGVYYDYTHQENNILESFGPAMSIWRYRESTKLVLETKDFEFINLWKFVTEGRSLKDGLNFDSFTNEYKISFINRAEYQLLKSKIEYYFGKIEEIRHKYWTNEEKIKLKEAIKNSKNGSYTLLEHNPKSSGLEYVLIALDLLTDKNEELIMGIE